MGVFLGNVMFWTGVWFWGGVLVTLAYIAVLGWRDRSSRWPGTSEPFHFEERECFLAVTDPNRTVSLAQYRDASIDANAELQRIERGVCNLLEVQPQDGSRLYDDIVSAVRDGQGWQRLFDECDRHIAECRLVG